MFVHRVRAGEQLDEVVEAHGQDDGQADSRPQSNDRQPSPRTQHIGGINTEFTYRFTVGGERGEVFRYVFSSPAVARNQSRALWALVMVSGW